MSTPPTNTGPDLAQRLVQVAYDEVPLADKDEVREAVVAVLRALVERPRHGGPHMYCRSEGELRGLINEIAETDRRA
jgi:hypothetical protein